LEAKTHRGGVNSADCLSTGAKGGEKEVRQERTTKKAVMKREEIPGVNGREDQSQKKIHTLNRREVIGSYGAEGIGKIRVYRTRGGTRPR